MRKNNTYDTETFDSRNTNFGSLNQEFQLAMDIIIISGQVFVCTSIMTTLNSFDWAVQFSKTNINSDIMFLITVRVIENQ